MSRRFALCLFVLVVLACGIVAHPVHGPAPDPSGGRLAYGPIMDPFGGRLAYGPIMDPFGGRLAYGPIMDPFGGLQAA